MKTITDPKKIEAIFARGTAVEFYPSKEDFVKRLESGERLKMYMGFDATFTALHLGHAKSLIFLEEMRQLGHEVIVLVGDFTAQIGDPSDKSATRKQLTREEVKHNISGWMKQIGSIIDFTDKVNPAKVVYNSEWLSDLTLTEVIHLASNFTVQQMMERDMFTKRMKAGTPIHLHEFMYPLLQGYDSIAMDVDVEICGTDQTFNALAGRTLMRRLKNKEKYVVALNLIANPKTGELMSKSNGTGVFIDVSAKDLFGSIMALPDPMIEPLFLNCTRIPLEEKSALLALGPRDAKARIASDIVKRLHGDDAAKAAEESFVTTFSKGGVPEDVQEVVVGVGELISDALVKAGVVPSKTEWRRLVTDGAVRTEKDEKIEDVFLKGGDPVIGLGVDSKRVVLKVGKRRFVKIVLK